MRPVWNVNTFSAYHNVHQNGKHIWAQIYRFYDVLVGCARVGHRTGSSLSGLVSHLSERPIAAATVDGTSGVIGTDGEQPPRADGHAGPEYLRVGSSNGKKTNAHVQRQAEYEWVVRVEVFVAGVSRR